MRNAWSRRMLEKIGQRAHSPRERYRDRPVYFLPDEAPQSPAGTLSDEEFIARWLDKSRAIWGQAEPDPQAWPYEDLGKWPIPSTALGLCDRVCPTHRRNCDAYGDGRLHNVGHIGPHACANCDHYVPRLGPSCPAGTCPWGVCT
jgi:hypothetical protein